MANLTREERAKRETEAKHESKEVLENPREPVMPVREDAPEPVTRGASAVPVGTPGTIVPDAATDPVQAAELRRDAEAHQPMARVRFKHGYFPKDGGRKIAVGTEQDLPITDARQLIEDGIAEHVAPLPSA